MDKQFLTRVFGEIEGFVYEYIGQIPEEIESESTDLSIHVTLEFLKGHGDNLLATRVIQFPHMGNKIMLYAKSDVDVNQSDDFVLITDLVPDPVIEPVVEEIVVTESPEEEPTVAPTEQPNETPTEGQ